MTPNLKPLDQQTIVITGGSSGIGLDTARRAARRGARVFLIARNTEALARISDAINAEGGDADYYAADVGDQDEVDAAADAAIARFGGFDTWVNCAGTGLYEELEDVGEDDHRRLFDTNYFGVVHGSRAAVRHLKTRGGAIVNIGSVLSDMSLPMLGVYAASKHAVKAYTNALRMELMSGPVSVTLIKPSSIDTPFVEHARNTMARAARVPPPVYRPEAVALAILAAAQHRHREITVGLGGAVMTAAAGVAPRLAERVIGGAMRSMLQSRDELNDGVDNLYAPARDGETRGPHRGVVPVSPFTALQASKAGRTALTLGSLALTALLAKRNAERIRTAAHFLRRDRRPNRRGLRGFAASLSRR